MRNRRTVAAIAANNKKRSSESITTKNDEIIVKNEDTQEMPEQDLGGSIYNTIDEIVNQSEETLHTYEEKNTNTEENMVNIDEEPGAGLESFEEPDVMNFGNSDDEAPVSRPTKQKKESAENAGFVAKFMAYPLWVKAIVVLVLVFLYMLKDEFSNGTPADVQTTSEMNISAPQSVQTDPQPEKPMADQKLEKLNACMIASQIAFRYEGATIIPTFGGADIANGALFCDEFAIKNYKLDGSNNSLSITGEVYSGEQMVKKLSVDPLAYFAPTYYYEGIGMKHPVTKAEVVYMKGDTVFSSKDMQLKLTDVKDTGESVIYSMLLNGQPTSLTVSKQFVQ